MTFSSYFNVLWKEPRLRITDSFFKELNFTDELDPEALHPVNLELVSQSHIINALLRSI